EWKYQRVRGTAPVERSGARTGAARKIHSAARRNRHDPGRWRLGYPKIVAGLSRLACTGTSASAHRRQCVVDSIAAAEFRRYRERGHQGVERDPELAGPGDYRKSSDGGRRRQYRKAEDA